MKQRIKLSEWAKLNSYTYRGAFNVYRAGNIPGAYKNASGSILVEIDAEDAVDEQDFVSMIVSFYVKLYGRKCSRKKAEKLIEGLKAND